MALTPAAGFIRIPPDGSGKRLTHSVMHEVILGSMTDVPNKNEQCSFGTSGLAGTISKVASVSGGYAVTVSLSPPVADNVISLVGEDFFENGIKIGVVVTPGELLYFPENVIVGGTNNTNVLDVNRYGAAKVTFLNGAPNFDAFGKTQVSQQHTLSTFSHQYGTLDDRFTSTITGTASYSHLPDTSGVLLSTGTNAGDRVVRTSDEYMIYQPGLSQLLIFTGAIGDTGKAGVVRAAGYYDDDNGLFFELNETTFNLVIRSKSTGTVTETRIPSIEWNADRMNGTNGVFNPSGIFLDPSKDNIFWIDFQGEGAGTVRFGVFVNGERVLLHSAHHTNTSPYSYMTTGSLPFRYEQYNKVPVGSSSEMRIFSATVKAEGSFNPRRVLNSYLAQGPVTTTSSVALLSIRPKETFNGIPNRAVMYMYEIAAYNQSADAIIVESRRGAETTGGTWVSIDDSSIAERNTGSTILVAGKQNWTVVVPPGERVSFRISAYAEYRQGFRRKADISLAVEQVISARLLSAGTGGQMIVTVAWDEVIGG